VTADYRAGTCRFSSSVQCCTAIGVWASRWIDAPATHQKALDALRDATEINARARDIEPLARAQLSSDDAASPSRCVLADAQFVIARAHGFLSWPKFVKHIESRDRAGSPVSAFEAAARAGPKMMAALTSRRASSAD
jgi:hypothetical protein